MVSTDVLKRFSAQPMASSNGMFISLAERIGSGGQAGVYNGKLRDPKTSISTSVVVKLTNVDLQSGSPETLAARIKAEPATSHLGDLRREFSFLQRLELEADLQRRIPRTPRIFGEILPQVTYKAIEQKTYDTLEVGMVLERIAGGTVNDYIKGGRYFYPEPAVKILQEVLLGLAELEGVGHARLNLGQERRAIVHGDIKPSNIFLTDTGIKMFDLGVSQYQGDLIRGGTVRYKSPEQQSSPEEGIRAHTSMDTFAVGLLFFEILTGKNISDFVPNRDSDLAIAYTMKYRHKDFQTFMRVTLATFNIPLPLVGFILCATAYNPMERYQDAEEMRQALRGAWIQAAETELLPALASA